MTELYKICPLGKGAIYVMPKPNQATLTEDIQFYKDAGVTQVISLLRQPEIERLGIQAEADTCQKLGLGFQNFKIKDMSVPELDALKTFNAQLVEQLKKGEHLAIHCHGGRGRAGIVAITLMIEHGMNAEESIALASQARGDRMPVSDEQKDFILAYPV